MSPWRLETSPEFDKAARQLDRSNLRRVKEYLEAVSALEDPRSRGRRLTNLAGFWRYGIGDPLSEDQLLEDAQTGTAHAAYQQLGLWPSPPPNQMRRP